MTCCSGTQGQKARTARRHPYRRAAATRTPSVYGRTARRVITHPCRCRAAGPGSVQRARTRGVDGAEFSLGHGWRPSGTWRVWCCASPLAPRVCVRHVIQSNSVGLLLDRTDGRRLPGADQSSFPGIRHAIWAHLRILTDITDSKPRAQAGQEDRKRVAFGTMTHARRGNSSPAELAGPPSVRALADEQRHHRTGQCIRGPNPCCSSARVSP